MCTRYALEKDLPETKEIMDAVSRSMLAQKFVITHGRPVITDGELAGFAKLWAAKNNNSNMI